jgi:formiminoglutamase
MARRREVYFAPYHAAVAGEIARLRAQHQRVVLYDCHSIRSVIPRLFAGELPNFNIGTNDGKACAPEITERVAAICAAGETFTSVVNGRFKGGWITRHYGNPANGVNAIQMELACRGYILEPDVPTLENWPPPYDEDYAAPMLTKLHSIIESLLP